MRYEFLIIGDERRPVCCYWDGPYDDHYETLIVELGGTDTDAVTVVLVGTRERLIETADRLGWAFQDAARRAPETS